MGKLREKLQRVRHGLTRLDDQPISRLALVVVLLLDLFILISVFDGLAEHTRQLRSPAEYIPQHCRDVVIDGDWNDDNRLIKVSRVAARYANRYLYGANQLTLDEEHPICAPITAQLRAIEADGELSTQLTDFLQLRTQTNEVRTELERTQGAYNTVLLERAAEDSGPGDTPAALKERTRTNSASLNSLIQNENLVEEKIGRNPKILALFNTLNTVSVAQREQLREDLRNSNFWHPIQRLGMEMIFLLPLMLIFYYWNARSLVHHRPLQGLVSSHLLVVVFIPVLFKVAELVYDIIPKKLLHELIELLQALKLVAIWHYLLMGIAVVAALALIYLLQKKLFSPQRLVEKRIAGGQCQNCGEGIAQDSAACALCGFRQVRQCGSCDRGTYVLGRFCRHCGAEDSL